MLYKIWEILGYPLAQVENGVPLWTGTPPSQALQDAVAALAAAMEANCCCDPRTVAGFTTALTPEQQALCVAYQETCIEALRKAWYQENSDPLFIKAFKDATKIEGVLDTEDLKAWETKLAEVDTVYPYPTKVVVK